MTERIDATLASVQRVMDRIEHGKGAFARLLSDDRLGNELASAVSRLEWVLAQAEHGEGLVASLLRNPETRADFESTLAEARQASASLKKWTAAVESNDSVANRLLTNEEVGASVGRDFEAIVHDLSSVASKLDSGKGSAAMLINDPKIFDAVNDIVVGVNQSKMLRWLLRNRQKKGIEARYKAAGGPPISHAEDHAPPSAAESLEATPQTAPGGGDGSTAPAPIPVAEPTPTPPSG